MAAGDINIDGIQISPEGLARLVAAVTQNIEAKSNDPGQIEVIDSLNGVTSIPVLQQIGSTVKLVRVLVSILRGIDGREVFLQVTETHLQWRYTDGMWDNLLALADLKGDKGETPVLRTNSNGIEWKYESEEEDAWKELVSYEALKLKFTDLTSEQIDAFWRSMPEDIQLLFQKPAQDAADKVLKDAKEVNENLTADVKALEERAETVIRETGESKRLTDQAAKAATDAANLANEKAGIANNAAGLAAEKAGVAEKVAQNTILVKQETEKSKDFADQAAKAAIDAANLANEKAGIANNAAGLAAEKAGVAEKAAQNADKATEAATNAANRATTLSDNRDKIVFGYWWKYDEELQDYVNTGVRATGETGQGLNIVGRYQLVDELKIAYPDGVLGCFEVGTESPYEIWYYDAPASEWRNSGRLQGPAGMTAFQVWKLQPGNECKTEEEYFDWLSPAIDPETGRWKIQGADTGVLALGINAEVTEKEDTEDSYILHVKSAKGEFDTPNIRGISVKVTEKTNTPDTYILSFKHAKGEFTTPNLRGFDVKVEEAEGNTPDDYKLKITTVTGTPNLQGRSGSSVIDIDHEPTETDTHYTYNNTQYAFSVGDEVRWYDKDNEEYVLFKLYAVTEVGAVWEEMGSGSGSLPTDVILTGPSDFSSDESESYIYLENGYLKGKEK